MTSSRKLRRNKTTCSVTVQVRRLSRPVPPWHRPSFPPQLSAACRTNADRYEHLLLGRRLQKGYLSNYKWKNHNMARCTAPVRGHSSAAACPACRYRSRYGYGGYGASYSPHSSSGASGTSHTSSGGSRSSGSSRPRWSRTGSSVSYTPAQVQSLTPIRSTIETRAAQQPDLRDVFL